MRCFFRLVSRENSRGPWLELGRGRIYRSPREVKKAIDRLQWWAEREAESEAKGHVFAANPRRDRNIYAFLRVEQYVIGGMASWDDLNIDAATGLCSMDRLSESLFRARWP